MVDDLEANAAKIGGAKVRDNVAVADLNRDYQSCKRQDVSK